MANCQPDPVVYQPCAVCPDPQNVKFIQGGQFPEPLRRLLNDNFELMQCLADQCGAGGAGGGGGPYTVVETPANSGIYRVTDTASTNFFDIPASTLLQDVDGDSSINVVEGGGALGGDSLVFTVDSVEVGSVEIIAGGFTKWTFDGIVDPISFAATPITTVIRDTLPATAGYLIFNSDTSVYQYHNGSGWVDLPSVEIFEDTAPLTGVAPTGSKLGVDKATGQLYYVSVGGNWVAVPVASVDLNTSVGATQATDYAAGSPVGAPATPDDGDIFIQGYSDVLAYWIASGGTFSGAANVTVPINAALQSVTGHQVDNTDPANPIVNKQWDDQATGNATFDFGTYTNPNNYEKVVVYCDSGTAQTVTGLTGNDVVLEPNESITAHLNDGSWWVKEAPVGEDYATADLTTDAARTHNFNHQITENHDDAGQVRNYSSSTFPTIGSHDINENISGRDVDITGGPGISSKENLSSNDYDRNFISGAATSELDHNAGQFVVSTIGTSTSEQPTATLDLRGSTTEGFNLTFESSVLPFGTTVGVEGKDIGSSTELFIKTGDVGRGTATNGQVLTLVDATTGEVEYQTTKYEGDFVVADWTAGSPNTLTINNATTGLPLGQRFHVSVYDSTNDILGIETNYNPTTGDLTLSTTGSTFDGSVVIS